MQAHLARHLTTIPDLAELNAECKHAPVVINRPIVLYGKGELGQMASDYLKAIGHSQVAWIDKFDISRAPLDALTLVAIAKHPYVPIELTLTEQGFTNVAPFLDVTPLRPEHPLANGWFADPLDLDRIQAVLDTFEDDVSRAHYVQFLAWRRLREEWTFEGAPVDVEGPRYWPPEVASVLHDHEWMIDGGAGDGRVGLSLRARMGVVRSVTYFDPEPTPGDFPVYTRPLALTDEDDPALWWKGFGPPSRLVYRSDTASASIPVSIVDAVCLDTLALAPTFIKLHLEGGELPALRGAAKTIAKHRPILAVTTYHSAEGMIDIPLWLRDYCPDYRFLWRNSAYVGESAVMFAVPNERAAA